MKQFDDEHVRRPDEFFEDALDLYKKGYPKGWSTGWTVFDKYAKVFPGTLNIVTGRPGSGKSHWLQQLAINLMVLHDLPVAMLSSEGGDEKILLAKLAAKMTQKPFDQRFTDRMSEEEFRVAIEFISKRFRHINHRLSTPEEIMISCKKVVQVGCKAIFIDPYSDIDKKRGYGVSEAEYTNKLLTDMRDFAEENQVAFFLVCHPNAESGKDQTKPIGLYGISGGAHFANKAAMFWSVARDYDNGGTKVHILKVKDEYMGKIHTRGIDFGYDWRTQGFHETDLEQEHEGLG